MTQPDSHAGERLRQLINGYQITQAIYVAVTLGLPASARIPSSSWAPGCAR